MLIIYKADFLSGKNKKLFDSRATTGCMNKHLNDNIQEEFGVSNTTAA